MKRLFEALIFLCAAIAPDCRVWADPPAQSVTRVVSVAPPYDPRTPPVSVRPAEPFLPVTIGVPAAPAEFKPPIWNCEAGPSAADEKLGKAIERFALSTFDDSVALLIERAQAGSAAAQFLLVCAIDAMQSVRFGNDRIPEDKRSVAHRSVDRAELFIDELPSRLGLGGAVKSRYDLATALLERAAEAGDPHARMRLGKRYGGDDRAVLIFRALHAEGHVDATFELGRLYLAGGHIARDPAEAIRLFELAADRGSVAAVQALAQLHHTREVPRFDPVAATGWYRRLAEQGVAEGRYLYALALRDGVGVKRNPSQAATLLELAYAQGNADAGRAWARMVRDRTGAISNAERDRQLLVLSASGNCDVLGLIDPADLERVKSPKATAGELDSSKACSPERSARGQSYEAWAEDVLRKLPASDPAAASAWVRAHEKTASAALENGATWQTGFESIALLVSPPRWLPTHVREHIDVDRWRNRVAQWSRRVEFVNWLVNDAIVAEPDLSFALSLLPEELEKVESWGTSNSADKIDFYFRIGLAPVAVDLLRRSGRKSVDETVNPSYRIQTRVYPCGLHDIFSALGLRLGVDQGQSNCGRRERISYLTSEQLADLAIDRTFGTAALLAARTYQPDVPGSAEAALRSLDGAYPDGIGALIKAVFLEEGRGVIPDPAQAAQLYAEASQLRADEGSVLAMGRQGMLLLAGLGVPRDEKRGEALLRNAAHMGLPAAKVGYGDALFAGLGTDRDPVEAIRWYRNAAEDGEAAAFVRLGFLAATGVHYERNLGADRWYALAARANDPMVFLDLARAAAFGPPERDAASTVRSWLERASSLDNRWAQAWLKACPVRSQLSCFKEQTGFAHLFGDLAQSASIADGVSRKARDREGYQQLARDIQAIDGRIDAIRFPEGKIAYNATTQIRTLLARREQLQIWHADIDGAIGTRLRRLIFEDEELRVKHGSLNNYFALLTSSCEWGEASRMAYGAGRPEAALFFAKMSINRLQGARAYIKDLPGDVRACFIEVHKDRYRWMTDLLIEMNRFAEAEAVLDMLKDFENFNYLRSAGRGSSSDQLVLNGKEVEAALAVDQASKTASQEDSRSRGAAFAVHLRALIDTVTGLDDAARAGGRSVEDRRGRLTEVGRAYSTDLARFDKPAVTLHAVVLPDRIHWLISTPDGQKALTIAVTEQRLAQAIGAYLVALQNRASTVTARGEALYRLIFAPVDAELRRLQSAGDVRHVMLSLDKQLRYVPFAALHDGDDWLIRRYTFSSFRRRGDYKDPPRGDAWTVAAFGASIGSGTLKPLPWVPQELRAIARTSDNPDGVLPGSIALDRSFTRASLAAALHQPYRVVHIASHFALDPVDGSKSYLLLGDGSRLLLRDFEDSGDISFAHADLVALSACQTALGADIGDGSEIDSMGAIAQRAGAPAVLASLWQVADDSTSLLMARFYRHRNAGLTKGEALRRAQLDLTEGQQDATGGASTRGEPYDSEAEADIADAYRHPYFWAPFILLGNWE